MLEFLYLVLLGVAASMVVNYTIVVEKTVVVVERLGKFNRVLKPGIHFLIPFIDRKVPMSWVTFVEVDKKSNNLALENVKTADIHDIPLLVELILDPPL